MAPAFPADAPDWPDDFARRYSDAGYWQDTTFFDALDAQAQRDPDALAIVGGACRLSYRDLLARIRRLAGGFARLGLTRGDAVVVHLPNGARFIETCFALFQLGVRPVLALPLTGTTRSARSAASPARVRIWARRNSANSTAARSRPRCRPTARRSSTS